MAELSEMMTLNQLDNTARCCWETFMLKPALIPLYNSFFPTGPGIRCPSLWCKVILKGCYLTLNQSSIIGSKT